MENVKKSGFIYLWMDTKRKMFYLGSHLGSLTDGYIGSNRRLQNAYKSRPHTFKRKILEYYPETDRNSILERENNWLSLIKSNELNYIKYYNEKKVAAGGDIFSTLSEGKKNIARKRYSEASKIRWKNKTPYELELIKKSAFGENKFSRDYLKIRNSKLCSKNAEIIHPNGTVEIINNITNFCKKHNLNRGNFCTMLRKSGYKHGMQGYKGKYI